MPNRRRAVALAVGAAVAGGAVAAGVFLTRGPAAPPATSPEAAVTTESPVGSDLGLDGISPVPTASAGPDPDGGQPVVTDEPVEVTGTQVPVTVTFHGWNEALGEVQVGGYVAGLVEEGGTCTLTLTLDDRRVTGSSTAVPDASTTACGAVTVPGDQVGPGTWQAVLRYESPRHSGTSQAWDVEVPR